MPWPAPLGNQCPERSGWPSARRGAGPPGGMTVIAYGLSCASTRGTHETIRARMPMTRRVARRTTGSMCSVLKLTDLAHDAVGELQRAGGGVVLPAVPRQTPAHEDFLAHVVQK